MEFSPIENLTPNNTAVIGIPVDRNSSYLRGPALAPKHIREALYCESSNLWTENLVNLGEAKNWKLLQDISFTQDDEFSQIEEAIRLLLDKDSQPISLGGDHSITYPVINAFAEKYPNLSILHLDAHPDLYEDFEGNRHSHASPFARIMESGLAKRLVQVGIRTMSGHQQAQAERFGVEVFDMKKIEQAKKLTFDGPVYLSLDMDCLDPAFAPGISHYEPGGMSTRQVLEIIQNFKGQLVGADIVEYNPERDIQNMTAMVAAKFLKELIGRMMEG